MPISRAVPVSRKTILLHEVVEEQQMASKGARRWPTSSGRRAESLSRFWPAWCGKYADRKPRERLEFAGD